MQYFSDIAELQAIASAAKVRVKKLPPAPHPDDDIDPAPEVTGPCQEHVQHFARRREAEAAGKVVEVVPDDAPYVDPRQAKLEASRAYHKENYVPRRRRGPSKAKTKAKKS